MGPPPLIPVVFWCRGQHHDGAEKSENFPSLILFVCCLKKISFVAELRTLFASRCLGLCIGAVKASLLMVDGIMDITIRWHILGNPSATMPDGHSRGLCLFGYEKLGARFSLLGLKSRKAGGFPVKKSYLRST
jgi:hypothetical protein